eukprot:2818578-Pleurochrysis_carterae.AAC.1
MTPLLSTPTIDASHRPVLLEALGLVATAVLALSFCSETTLQRNDGRKVVFPDLSRAISSILLSFLCLPHELVWRIAVHRLRALLCMQTPVGK